MNKFMLLSLIVFSSACTLTNPEGTLALNEAMQNEITDKKNQNVLMGDPVFLKVEEYPQISNGNVLGHRRILLQVEREKIDISKLMKSLEE